MGKLRPRQARKHKTGLYKDHGDVKSVHLLNLPSHQSVLKPNWFMISNFSLPVLQSAKNNGKIVSNRSLNYLVFRLRTLALANPPSHGALFQKACRPGCFQSEKKKTLPYKILKMKRSFNETRCFPKKSPNLSAIEILMHIYKADPKFLSTLLFFAFLIWKDWSQRTRLKKASSNWIVSCVRTNLRPPLANHALGWAVQRPHSGFNAEWARHTDSLGIQFVGCLYNLRARGNCVRDPAPQWFKFCNAADVRSQNSSHQKKGRPLIQLRSVIYMKMSRKASFWFCFTVG